MIEAVAGRLEGAPRQFRRWSDEFKAQAVAESMEPGASVSVIARHIGIDPSQLFTWRRNARLKAEAVVDAARGEGSTADIMIGDAVLRVNVGIGESHLVRLIRAVRSA
ncbi:transposase [Sinorhizobium fredii]|uniref:transposase n=1 Tax=Rhizobium fredii TaxID=380 RepID=UPI001FCB19ED|nr:transposase [Sinorhizobium fredii]WOS66043.1 transposase [Sinorhizobium fredii GR64]